MSSQIQLGSAIFGLYDLNLQPVSTGKTVELWFGVKKLSPPLDPDTDLAEGIQDLVSGVEHPQNWRSVFV